MPKLNWYRKELVSNPVMVGGKRVPFETLSNNRGVIVLDEEKPEEAPIIAALNDLSQRQKYGVVKITEEEYAQKKTQNPPVAPSLRRKPEKLRVMQPLKPKQPSPEKKPVPVVNPKPATTQTQTQTTSVSEQAAKNPAGAPSRSADISVGAGGEAVKKPAPAFVPRTAAKPDVQATEIQSPVTTPDTNAK